MTYAHVRVLIVDDQQPFRDAAKVVFELLDDFDVVGEATSGEQALERATTLQPDLVIMDINLPAMNGIRATQELQSSRPETAVILVSTYNANALPSGAATSGALAYVHKEHLDADLIEKLWNERAEEQFHTA
jgi:two-component system invasion response regulator UvrY